MHSRLYSARVFENEGAGNESRGTSINARARSVSIDPAIHHNLLEVTFSLVSNRMEEHRGLVTAIHRNLLTGSVKVAVW
jgi:hypothetical protein